MLRVLHHYLPIRKALLILSETVLMTLVLLVFMTAHLWNPSFETKQALTRLLPAMNVDDAWVRCILSCVVISVLAQLAIAFNELYDVRVSSSRVSRAARFVESTGSALALALGAVVVSDTWGLRQVLDFPPLSITQIAQSLVFAMLAGFALLYNWRTLFHYVLRRAAFSERVLIYGAGTSAHTLAREILERPDAGFDVVGIVPGPSFAARRANGKRRTFENPPEIPAGWPEVPEALLADAGTGRAVAPATKTAPKAASTDLTSALVLDPLPPWTVAPVLEPGLAPTPGSAESPAVTTLYDLVSKHRVDVLVVALEDRREGLPTEQLLQCRLAGVSVLEQEALYEQITGKIAVQALRPSYLIFNEGFSRQAWNELAKRTLDLACSLVVLLITWPLMLATAIAVRFDSPGPILFAQERVGRDGRSFTLFKFRSMRADAEKLSGPVWATQDDPRITRSGKFIRRTRLDELPQLFNVIAGHMSMIGPRPERPHFVDDLAKKIPYYRQRHIVKPGLTGWAQINYRYGSSLEDAVQKLQYDLFYIKNMSLLFDVSILFNTVKIVILRKGT
jgi:lipopolysaccharide/colanic/teichoic acid biosynthesis glycosyltransferase